MIIIMLAIAKNGVIGKNNDLPWHIPEESKLFRDTTKDNVVVMGRKTYDSLPKKWRPLPNRVNIVVSRSMEPEEDVIICSSVGEAIGKGKTFEGKDVFVVGGAQVVKQSFGLADKMYLSHLKKEYEGDTYFPKYDEDDWEVESEKEFDDFIYKVYKRK